MKDLWQNGFHRDLEQPEAPFQNLQALHEMILF
ncbi:unnamed protein product [Larinioides sclopetarius]|uniref:Uncharacterized protein n=1 Tax=Larinioides sclopetarius TaxID=280406 RepID=A0AAV1ZGG0_9ARAC